MASTFPGEGVVLYDYAGDGKRRERWTLAGEYTGYKWAGSPGGLEGFTVLNEENSSGTLTRTYVGRSAQIDGSSAASGTWRFYLKDHLGSVRQVRSTANSLLASYDYTPYGEEYVFTGDTDVTSHLYTGHEWDGTANMYFAPYRFYDPVAARWITPDPLGMVDGPNLYGYVGGKPSMAIDRTGLNYMCFDMDGDGYPEKCYRLKKKGELSKCKEKECNDKYQKAIAKCAKTHGGSGDYKFHKCMTKARVNQYKCYGKIGFLCRLSWNRSEKPVS